MILWIRKLCYDEINLILDIAIFYNLSTLIKKFNDRKKF